jgi:hypothetical protein
VALCADDPEESEFRHYLISNCDATTEYQRQGFTCALSNNNEQQLTGQTLSDNEQLTKIVTLLNYQEYLVFFLIVFIVSIVLSLLAGTNPVV